MTLTGACQTRTEANRAHTASLTHIQYSPIYFVLHWHYDRYMSVTIIKRAIATRERETHYDMVQHLHSHCILNIVLSVHHVFYFFRLNSSAWSILRLSCGLQPHRKIRSRSTWRRPVEFIPLSSTRPFTYPFSHEPSSGDTNRHVDICTKTNTNTLLHSHMGPDFSPIMWWSRSEETTTPSSTVMADKQSEFIWTWTDFLLKHLERVVTHLP